MKSYMKYLLIGALMIFSTLGFSQEPSKYGEDEMECKKNLSLYVTFYKQNNYKDAMLGWRYVFDKCPKASKNVFIHGTKMFQSFIDKEKDETVKEGLKDTLMLIYDRRIENFGEECKVKGRKGVDMHKYKGKEFYQEAYNLCKFSLDNCGDDSEGGVLVVLMQLALELQAEGKLECGEVVDNYAASIDILDKQIKKYTADTTNQKKMKKAENLKKGKKNIDNLFVNSPCASCEAVIPIFNTKFDAEPDNVPGLKNMLKVMTKRKCTDDPLYEKVLDKLFEVAPDEVDPYAAARYYAVKKNDYAKAMEYYKLALESSEDDEEKADIYYQMAGIAGFKLGSFSQGRSYAYEAIKLKDNWGDPYILIAKLYASSSGSCGETACTKAAVYWVAVDKLLKAKTVDSNCAGEANSLIGSYSARFPSKEDCFFENIMAGQSYTVGCWISETTTTRFNGE